MAKCPCLQDTSRNATIGSTRAPYTSLCLAPTWSLQRAFTCAHLNVATYALTSASSDPADVRAWLHANCFPSVRALARRVPVWYVRPASAIRVDRRDASCKARTRIDQAGRVPRRGVYLDGAERWAKRLREMYGVKVGSEPVIVVADHEVQSRCALLTACSGWCTMTRTGRVRDRAQLNERRIETILAGTARSKHSQNLLERTSFL